jgi:hypothetical protein
MYMYNIYYIFSSEIEAPLEIHPGFWLFLVISSYKKIFTFLFFGSYTFRFVVVGF